MKRGGILRLLIAACLAMAMLAAPQARARAGTAPASDEAWDAGAGVHTAMASSHMDCCPDKHAPAPPSCPKCPLMAMCSSPCLDLVRKAESVRPVHRILVRALPEDEREPGDHATPPLRKPPRSQG